MSILTHPAWPILRRYIDVEPYARDTSKHGARYRLEVNEPDNPVTRSMLLGITMPCVACGTRIHPVRQRPRSRSMYYVPTCEQAVTRKCSRGAAARVEYILVRHAVETWRSGEPDDPARFQNRLF